MSRGYFDVFCITRSEFIMICSIETFSIWKLGTSVAKLDIVDEITANREYDDREGLKTIFSRKILKGVVIFMTLEMQMS